MKNLPTINSCDPLVLEALEKFGKAYSVIYFCKGAPDEIYPLFNAGGFRNRPFFMIGNQPKWFPEHLEARVNSVSVAFYSRSELEFYVTPVHEAPEVDRGKMIDTIDSMRNQFGVDGHCTMSEAIEVLDPFGELK